MDERERNEEYRMIGSAASWLILVVFTAAVISWGMWMMMTVRDAPREWDMGALPETPASSEYSSIEPPQTQNPPRQLAPVPGSVPIDTVEHGVYSPPEPRETVPQK
jgi:hypothetical protein